MCWSDDDDVGGKDPALLCCCCCAVFPEEAGGALLLPLLVGWLFPATPETKREMQQLHHCVSDKHRLTWQKSSIRCCTTHCDNVNNESPECTTITPIIQTLMRVCVCVCLTVYSAFERFFNCFNTHTHALLRICTMAFTMMRTCMHAFIYLCVCVCWQMTFKCTLFVSEQQQQQRVVFSVMVVSCPPHY